ncbi:MAG TPA: tRNA epoxyqueuosine(34) reductase QueG [Vicinamibacterales bacterium]|nr:tRNA epoxyqueuosine(34) reductase QueG [Vicinamibacterales bacterium]
MALTSASIKARAREIGFDLCGIAPAAAFDELGMLREWLARGCAGEMAWMERTAEKRLDVRRVLPSARAVIATATVYNTDREYATRRDVRGEAVVSRYAWGRDYHDVIGARLEELLAWMRAQSTEPFEAKAYVDTGPVQERVFAQYAGLGWIGKNTCLINPDLGSWLFLGVILTSLPLEFDPPAVDQCGSCRLCLEACPTGALVEPRLLDSRRCLSYLTIEKRGVLDPSLLEEMGTFVYGCDICQEVCPWNERPAVSAAPEWQPRAAFDRRSLVDLWRLSDDELRALVHGGPMTRAKVVGLRRNLAIAIGNSAGVVPPDLLDGAENEDPARPSLQDPGVVAAIHWSRRRLQQ